MDVIGVKILAGPGVKFGVGFGAAKTGLMIGYYLSSGGERIAGKTTPSAIGGIEKER